MINIQLAERHFPAFTFVSSVVLHIHPSLEVQRLDAPGLADVGVPLVAGSANAQCPLGAEVDEVGKFPVEFYAGGDGDDPGGVVVGVHAVSYTHLTLPTIYSV